jgi:hypothetical protein
VQQTRISSERADTVFMTGAQIADWFAKVAG